MARSQHQRPLNHSVQAQQLAALPAQQIDLKEQWKELVSGSASRFRFNSFEIGREIVAQPLFDQADGHS